MPSILFLSRQGLLFAAMFVIVGAHGATPQDSPARGLRAFASEEELAAWLKQGQADPLKSREAYNKVQKDSFVGLAQSDAAPAQAPAAEGMMAKAAAPAARAAEPGAAKDESITNTQTAGVDEGGIVKTAGKYLIVLRRGRLFTIDTADNSLRPVSTIDAFPPDMKANPHGAWYDEMLVNGKTVVVIGYSYARAGTEVSLFNIDDNGRLSYGATYHLRSADYYSSRNYASRLIGNKLIFYTPLPLSFYGDPYQYFPGVRKWQGEETAQNFTRIAPATRIYRSDDAPDYRTRTVLHTVTSCDLGKASMKCEASAVIGPASRQFYVSQNAVYLWTGNNNAAVYRLPFDNQAPSAAKVTGMPIDQFSFLESEDGHLNVLLRESGRGNGMWGSGASSGNFSLLRFPLSALGDGQDALADRYYRKLRGPRGWTVQNRFMGPWLLYGAGPSWNNDPNAERDQQLFALRYADGERGESVKLSHAVERIEALGNDAIIVGRSGNDLHFSSIKLAEHAEYANRYVQKNAAQGETRSHGFFYKSEEEGLGIVGIPIRGGNEPGYRQLRNDSAGVLFLRNLDLKLRDLGVLRSSSEGMGNDDCKASCVDWYGNARPIFMRKRIFALMGYELVEGELSGGAIREVKRISFMPRSPRPAREPWID